MSTRSTIAIRRGPASIESIYCHFDGYPDGVGSKLISHYNSIEKVEALIRLGNVSCLREGWHFSEGPHYDGSIGKWEPLTSESIARRS